MCVCVCGGRGGGGGGGLERGIEIQINGDTSFTELRCSYTADLCRPTPHSQVNTSYTKLHPVQNIKHSIEVFLNTGMCYKRGA